MKNGPKFFGKALVGTKGQIVIPIEARKMLEISPGDSVVIISGPPDQKKIISLIPEEAFNEFLKLLEGHLSLMRKEVSKKTKKGNSND